MEPLIRRLKLQELKPYEEIEYYEGKAIIYVRVLADLAKFFERGYIDKRLYKKNAATLCRALCGFMHTLFASCGKG